MKRWIALLLAGFLLPFSAFGQDTGISVSVPEKTLHPWDSILIRFFLPEDGTAELILMDEEGEERFPVVKDYQAVRGQNSLFWNGTYAHQTAPEGIWRLVLRFGALQAETRITIGTPLAQIMENPAPLQLRFTPATTSPYDGMDQTLNYWTLPMNIHDEEAIWQVLTSPITVVENGKGERAQVILRAEPSAESAGVGSITCMTQGVHVISRGEEWSLVECYSSSFHDSPILNWNALVQGYVPTEYLTEITPSQELGFVIDKLTQRLYVFREGRLFSTLLVSTGLSNPRQPYNETRSGEFLMTSKVGTFSSDNLRCGLAIRFNRGDLLHEVPYTLLGDGSASYSLCEPKLGTKASHGCIRVQRKLTPEGVNMGWIWANLKNNSRTRLLIWEDWQGRQIEIPAEDTPVYYNPRGGQYYHLKETCDMTRAGIRFTSFPYGQLDEKPYSKLKRCPYCAPLLRRAEIEAINAQYAFGGDHDPVLTEARESCPRPLK